MIIMTFGKDFFKLAQLILGILRLIGRIMGDADDKKNDDEAAENCATEINKIIK